MSGGLMREVQVGGILVSPFVGYAALALLILLALRPVFRRIGFDRIFANPPLTQAAIYVVILGALIVLA